MYILIVVVMAVLIAVIILNSLKIKPRGIPERADDADTSDNTENAGDTDTDDNSGDKENEE